NRAAMRAGEQLLLLEQVQVTPDGGLGDLEPARQIEDGNGPVLVELLQDLTESILLAHIAHPTRIRMLISSIPMSDLPGTARPGSHGMEPGFGPLSTLDPLAAPCKDAHEKRSN